MTRFALALAVLTGCTSPPAEIRIKGPRDAVESTQASPTFGPFERKGDTLRLRASAFDARGRYLGTAAVDWDSSDRTVATVSQTGVVTFLSTGSVTIRARTQEAPKVAASLPLEARIVESVRITGPDVPAGGVLKLAMGETANLSAEVFDDRGRKLEDARVRWRSTSYVATVTITGEVEGRAIGTGQVVVEAKNGASARVDVEVGDWPKGRRRRR